MAGQAAGSIPAQAGEPFRMSGKEGGDGVYPRAGGGTGKDHGGGQQGNGLSPRRRGNPRHPCQPRRRWGSIPAQAGEPETGRITRAKRTVYPRAGGGTDQNEGLAQRQEGLSPRRRGNHCLQHLESEDGGSIPAQAGEPLPESRPETHPGVYPRAGGGTVAREVRVRPPRGLSPRRRGNRILSPGRMPGGGSIPAQAGEPRADPRGSSRHWVYPRAGGGTIRAGFRAFCPVGSIPAQAGEPWIPPPGRIPAMVYPRAGGGTSALLSGSSSALGLSPRRRGNLDDHPPIGRRLGSIPAQAGEPPTSVAQQATIKVYPRAGGGTAQLAGHSRGGSGLSPRRRGNLAGRVFVHPDLRSIPAQAGEPWSFQSKRGAAGVYPRAGGGTSIGLSGAGSLGGLSPRRRGNPPPACLAPFAPRSIPAQAGEPGKLRAKGVKSGVYPRAGGGTSCG